MKPSNILPISSVLSAIGKPIAYYPEIAKAIGSVKACIFLCQFLYWDGKQKDKEGWIYKTLEEIQEETGLSFEEQRGARKVLKDLKILKEEKRGIPARNYYKFDWNILDELLSNYYAEKEKPQETENLDDKTSENPTTGDRKTPPLLTENTTQETTINKYSQVLEKWNSFADKHKLSKVNKLTDTRIKKLKRRLENKDFDIDKILELVAKSKFLLGQNDRGWQISFDFLIENDDHYTRILEGGYGINSKPVEKKYSYDEVLRITNGKILGKFERRDDGFWYEIRG